MEFFNVVHSRRSVRQFLPTPVARADLNQIVQAGIEAPSGCNEQLRQYVVVDDPAVLDRFRPLSKALANAPAAIVLLIDPKPTQYGEFWIQDASAAMENMLLAAVALGYAGCWVEGPMRRKEGELREILGVPESLRVWSILSVGKAAVMPERPLKPSLQEATHYNRYEHRPARQAQVRS